MKYIKRVEWVFEVVAEPNQRGLLRQRLREIRRQLHMPLPAVLRQLRVRRRAIEEIDAWLARFRRFWSAHVDALEHHLNRQYPSAPTQKKANRKRSGSGREPNKGETK